MALGLAIESLAQYVRSYQDMNGVLIINDVVNHARRNIAKSRAADKVRKISLAVYLTLNASA